MFDLGFWELMLVGVITLLVVGPERLPGLARTAGMWLGRLRRFVQTVKQDIDQELAAEELKKTLSRQASIPELEEIVEETDSAVRDVNKILHSDDPVSNSVADTDKDASGTGNRSTKGRTGELGDS